MSWTGIDTQAELVQLDERIVWDDSSVMQFYATSARRDGLPTDVSLSGHHSLNLYIVIADSLATYELALLGCDRLGKDIPLVLFGLDGRVDSLKRVEVRSRDGETLFRCARLAFRILGPSNDGFRYVDFDNHHS